MKASLAAVLTSAVAVLLLSTVAYADCGPGTQHACEAPAPLLAAGLPSLIAVVGGAMVTRLRRRKGD
jgi:hypothetical protein